MTSARRAHRRRGPDRVAGGLRAARLLAQPDAGLLLLRDAGHAPAALRRAQQRWADPGAGQHPLRHLLPAGHPGLRDRHHPVREHGGRHRDPARQRTAQAHARHAAARLGLRLRPPRLDGPRLGRHDRRHAGHRMGRLRRAPARRGGAGRRRHRAAGRRHLRRAGHGRRHDHPQRRGRSRRRQRADPAALLHLGHLVPAHRRAGVARRRGEVLPARASGQRLARRLRPAQPRVGVVGQRPLRAGHLAAGRHAPGDALLAAGDGALSAQVPDRFRVPAARVAGIFAIFISLPAVIGLLGDEPSAGRRRGRHRRTRRLLRVLLPRGARADAPQAAGGRRARLRHRPGHRRHPDRRRSARLEPALLLRGGHGRPAPAAARGTSSCCRSPR